MNSAPATIRCDILIVGAGIAGAAAAAALRNRGYSIVHVEMSDRPLDTARGDHLQCVVVEILDKWGALPAFWAAGAEKRQAARYANERGETFLEIDYRRLPIPHRYYLYLHHELIAETFLKLAAENPDYVLFRPARAREFDVGPEGIRSLRVHLDKDSPQPAGYTPGQSVTIEPRLVIGGDGRPSRVRQVLGFTTEEYEYNSPVVVHFAPRLPHETDPTNWFTSFMGPNGSAGRIPRAFGGWKLGLTIAKSEIEFWKTASKDQRRAAFGAIAPELGELDLSLGGFYPVKLINTHRWSQGNTVLIGDACHAMHPARGQGMNVAIRSLDRLLDYLPARERLNDATHLAEQLRAYEQHVKPGIDAVLAENHALGARRDTLSREDLIRAIDEMKAIQDDPERHAKYCLASAGYGDRIAAAQLKA